MSEMRIVIDNSGYHLRNMGDVSMLQVAARRLRSRLGECDLAIVTTAPERLARFVGGRPVDPGMRACWNRAPLLPKRPRWFPASLENYLSLNEHSVRVVRPRLARRLASVSQMVTFQRDERATSFVREIEAADAVIATGGGFLTDAFEQESENILQTLWLGVSLRKPTAMFGQGIGPVENPRLRARMAEVLPSLDLIALRESRGGAPLLRELGVASNRIICTGDDAIELAYHHRPESLGGDLGVNLRLSGYSGVSDEDRAAFAAAIGAFQARSGRQARLIPISFHETEDDAQSARDALDLSRIAGDDAVRESPESIVRAVGRCRLVVTGSYHAAVFALSQGIPVVGWARSPYYENKFLGLAAMFGAGCHVVCEGGSSLEAALLQALHNCDASADALREPLLAAAKQQITQANAAYDQFCEMLQPAVLSTE